MSKKVVWPFGIADKVAVAYAAIIAYVIDNTFTLLTIGQLTGACTLNLTLHGEQRVGDRLIVRTSVDGTNRTLTHGTGMTGLAQVLTANKSYNLVYEFDGVAFIHVATNLLN